MLRFSGGLIDGEHRGWDGPWPPPERLGVAVGNETGYVSIFDVDATVVQDALPRVRTIARVQFYKRVSASALPDDFESEHVFRGAEYEAEEA